ncbi:protein of unknown function DUF554 [Coriobacterium glomerans PW2]|uniref:DUF554 domain-containing protein n=1 Tax=Coriobacterium glomerans (strain ATCC 49209 / DSM 20642 / JCM 10262 / PW2) TaxID=700015 RepID=F2N9Z5_CORGP|nr:DUF554 domain-containing protein [Coriobacterium glomerans]AEB06250.1 protein of unknown function DUF554 [Coriobacterium glomerans PW2]
MQFFPIGIIINVSAVVLGGLAGALLGPWLPKDLRSTLNLIFGACSMTMGISYIVKLQTLPAIMLTVIVGTAIGHLIHLEGGISAVARRLQGPVSVLVKSEPAGDMSEDQWMNRYIAAVVLFCASGTGIFGALQSGLSGDQSILISKAILDFFTAAIFAADLGFMTPLIGVPQLVVMMVLFMLAGVIMPYTNEIMVSDFRACGGILMLCTGMRICGIKNFPIANMLPAMILIMPISHLFADVILPLIG